MPGSKLTTTRPNEGLAVADTTGQSNYNNWQEGGQVSNTVGSSAEYLNLGENKNYKTATISKRWEQERSKWLKKAKGGSDPKDGLPTLSIPNDHKQKTKSGTMSLRKKVKRTMKSVQSPYDPFESYYPLEEVIDTYMEIWYQSDSSDSSSS